jgi:SGNH hydrolase-like domain, acetyltransferase AlgX
VNKGIRRLVWAVVRAVLIALITFVLTEITFRVYGHFQPTFIFHGSSFSRSYNMYRGKPNSPDYDSKLNSHGFKGKDYTIAKPPNTYRIIAIGDSFTFGVVPYQYNYVNLIEQGLKQRSSGPGGRTYEVINMGISATGPRDYLTLLTDEGLALHPDMLIVSVFIGNDFIEAQRNDVGQDARFKRPWYRSSYVLSFLNYVFTVTRKYEGTIRLRKVYDDNEPSYPKDAFLEIQRSRLQNFVKNDAEFLNAFRIQMGYLHQIKRICAQRHIKLLAVAIPDEMQVNRPQLRQVLQSAKRTPEQVDMQQPNQLLDRDFAANGIACIDLLPEFARSKETLYKPRNTHWNIAGNRLAAELITPKVIELLQQQQGP